MRRPNRKRAVLGGVAAAATLAGVAGVAYQRARSQRLNSFLARVDVQLNVTLATYCANLNAAACDGVSNEAAHEIMAYNPPCWVEADELSVQISAVPRLFEQRLDTLEVHILGERPLLEALVDFVAKGRLQLPGITAELGEGSDGDMAVVTLATHTVTFGDLRSNASNGVEEETLAVVAKKLAAN